MNAEDPNALVVGQPYPGALPGHDAAVLELFRAGGGHLLIAVSNLTPPEVKALRKGPLSVGVLQADTALRVLWQFADTKRRPVFTFDTPFDARRIEPAQRELIDKHRPNERLAIPIYIVDSATGVLRGIRLVTLDMATTDAILSTVMDQLAAPEKRAAALAQETRWDRQPPEALVSQAVMRLAGR